jgi:hypothetical protein
MATATIYCNVEDNDETTQLLGQDIDATTPWRQHDSAWIRIPTQIAIAVVDFGKLLFRVIVSTLGTALSMIGKLLTMFVELLQALLSVFSKMIPLLLLTSTVIAILLALDLLNGEVPLGKMVALAFSMISLSIASKFR